MHILQLSMSLMMSQLLLTISRSWVGATLPNLRDPLVCRMGAAYNTYPGTRCSGGRLSCNAS